jgi:hypothetical protein
MNIPTSRQVATLVAGVGVLSLAASSLFYCNTLFIASPVVDAPNTDILVEGAVVGQRREVVCRINNKSEKDIRVLGLVQC